MNYTSEHLRDLHALPAYKPARVLSCNWQALRAQLLRQWSRIPAHELDRIGPDCRRIAMLIEDKYGIGSAMIENYLRNFERTMPLQ